MLIGALFHLRDQIHAGGLGFNDGNHFSSIQPQRRGGAECFQYVESEKVNLSAQGFGVLFLQQRQQSPQGFAHRQLA